MLIEMSLPLFQNIKVDDQQRQQNEQIITNEGNPKNDIETLKLNWK